MKNQFSWLLRNPWVLGILAVVSAIHVIYYSQTKKNVIYAAILVMSGAVASFFSRNMVVILLFALGITHLVWFSQKNMFREGMETITDTEEEEIDDGMLVSTGAETIGSETTNAGTTSAGTTNATSALATNTEMVVPPSTATQPPTTTPDDVMVQINDPPTAMDRKLEDLQLKINKLQTELSSIQLMAT